MSSVLARGARARTHTHTHTHKTERERERERERELKKKIRKETHTTHALLLIPIIYVLVPSARRIELKKNIHKRKTHTNYHSLSLLPSAEHKTHRIKKKSKKTTHTLPLIPIVGAKGRAEDASNYFAPSLY